MTFRSQLQGFFMGCALVGGLAMYQLQKDIWSSHRMITESVGFATCCHGHIVPVFYAPKQLRKRSAELASVAELGTVLMCLTWKQFLFITDCQRL